MFKPISDNTAYSQKIVAAITDAIVRGELRPGNRLPTERDLAIQFGVSRTAVRDAIKLLAGQGIVSVRHGIGIFISESLTLFSDVDGALQSVDAAIQDLFEIRKVLESEAAFWAAERAAPRQIDHLQHILDDAKLHSANPEMLGQRDADFHIGLAEASQNKVLVRLMLTMIDLLSESRMKSLSIPGVPQKSLAEHQLIVEAIRQKQCETAKQRMIEHLTRVERSILGGKLS